MKAMSELKYLREDEREVARSCGSAVQKGRVLTCRLKWTKTECFVMSTEIR